MLHTHPEKLITFSAERLLSDMEDYPLHFFTHLVQACEIIGYKLPYKEQAAAWLLLYRDIARGAHLNAETEDQLDDRLGTTPVEHAAKRFVLFSKTRFENK
jgi:hypothetical protein